MPDRDTPSERRRFPRLQIVRRSHDHTATLDTVTVLDMSPGGVCVLTVVGFPVGASVDLKLSMDGMEPVNLPARVVHGLRADNANGATNYFTGLEFVADGTSDAAHAIERFVANA